ncbi:DNA circularization protein [Amphritea sp. HPY]|uniref:DNA circularization protein n=1 Tax=Amphritea sp. HPY TaxID=3421652 RepID=UPI003D7E0103
MSDWLNKLLPASFRGLQFHLIEIPETEVGRRTADHEYAGRDDPYSEDTGRKQRVYTVPGGVDGADFLQKAHALQDAFEAEGPGLLIHPYYGELYVTVQARIRFEGRFASFILTCKESGHNDHPVKSIDSRQAITDKAIAAEAAAIQSFNAGFDVKGPAFIGTAAVDQIAGVLDSISTGAAGSSGEVSGLIRQPLDLAKKVFGSVSSISQVATKPMDSLRAYESLITDNPVKSVSGATPSQILISKNQAASALVFQQAAAIESAKTLVDVDFEHQAEAEQAATAAYEMLEQVSWQSDDAGFRTLSDLRVAVQQDMQLRMPELPKLQQVSLAQTTPSLVASYKYTGSADNEQQLITRNSVRHPGFVQGEIEVINV